MTTIRQKTLFRASPTLSSTSAITIRSITSRHWRRLPAREESLAAKDAIAQILINPRMCAEDHRRSARYRHRAGVPQGRHGRALGTPRYRYRRWSTKAPRLSRPGQQAARFGAARPSRQRQNSKDNTPAVVHMRSSPATISRGNLRGQGRWFEAKSKFAMLNPSDNLVEWVLKTVPTMGAGWCPPGILGVGIGGTPEKRSMLAKGIADGAGRYPGSDRPGFEESRRGTAHRVGQRRSTLALARRVSTV